MDTSAFYRHVLDASPDGMWLLDLAGTTVYVNDRAAELLGRRRDELEHLPVSALLPEIGGLPLADRLALLVETGASVGEVEASYLLPDGGRKSLLVAESLVRDDNGTATGCIHRLTEATPRRTLVHELSRSREQLDEAQAIARIGSWELDLGTDEMCWSKQMYAMFGADAATFVPTSAGYLARIAAADRLLVSERMRAAREGRGELEFDARATRPDGTLGWFRHRGRLVRDDDGNPIRLGGTVQDITETKQTELQLTDAVELNAMMQLTATAANDAETLAEAMLAIRELLLLHDDWQRAVAFSVSVEGAGGRRLVPFLFPSDGPEHDPKDWEVTVAEKVLSAGTTVFEEEPRPDAPSIGFPVHLAGGLGMIIVATTRSPFERHAMLRSMAEQVAGHLARVAERERAAAELAAARDAAMEASRLKSQFVATMSHEIRTPMNGVIGLNELLLRTDLDNRQKGLARGVKAAGQTLLGLINDILDFSKIESGELVLEVVDFDLRSVFEQTRAILGSAAGDKGITLTVEVDEDLPQRVVGDPTRLGQVLANLMSNAVKFTSHGSVTVRAMAERSESSDLGIRVLVVDTGIGVSPEKREHLFEPFQQADASTTRNFGGTGLGLAICHQLVAAMGGELGLTSTPGEGSTFWFTARLGRADGLTSVTVVGEERTAEPTGGRTGHLLVVEDNDINQLVAVGLLEMLGYTVDVAASGDEAVASVAARRYDAILMDLQMPRMDGYTAARLIRSHEAPGARVPIIAMTASAVEGERERCAAAGMDDFLSKPVDSSRVSTVLARHLGGPPTSTTPARPLASALDERRLDELLEMGERAVALVNRAVDNFVNRMPATLSEIEDALRDKDWEALRALVHRFRGSALNLGATRVAGIGSQLELLDDDDMPACADELLQQLQHASAEAVVALQDYLRRSRTPA